MSNPQNLDFTFNSLKQAKQYLTPSMVKHFNENAGGYFFSKDTLKFFNNKMSDFKVWAYSNGNVFLFESKRGIVRQVLKTGAISTPLHFKVGFQRAEVVDVDGKRHFDSVRGDIDYDTSEQLFKIILK